MVVTVLEELNRRSGLSIALSGRGDKELPKIKPLKSLLQFYLLFLTILLSDIY